MKKTTHNESGWRGSPELWFQAATEILLESGVDGVKIATLAKRLGLSRTSFYWFFSDREALLSALVESWKEKNTGSLVKQTTAYADSLAEATLNVFDCWIDQSLFDSKLEFAIRSWSLQSKSIQEEVRQADSQRLTALANMLKRYGFNDIQADVHARTIYLVQIGYISMQTEESLAQRMQRISEYVNTFTGTYPKDNELERFYHKHGYQAI
ncbi:Tetracycline repressor protein class A from transposon 1721 [Marinomonas aquimarina]|uniref:Tetracycline repressor protein class A from transposon 1721 n=1 Tax=Marinomonas aquimarina TaxID=295068 RepID=A0A1A8TQ08_9GAMM|nr:TetR/AcrR family transcriptional regulator [Marinomonas aquimarina]SBS35165.1 Tetracycline repressor protein class A from transposon 1721 [Marinomonas aquimarina]